MHSVCAKGILSRRGSSFIRRDITFPTHNEPFLDVLILPRDTTKQDTREASITLISANTTTSAIAATSAFLLPSSKASQQDTSPHVTSPLSSNPLPPRQSNQSR